MSKRKVVTKKVWGQLNTVTREMTWLGRPGETKAQLPTLWENEVWIRATLTYEVPDDA